MGKVKKGERIAGVAAAILFIVMFFDWFGADRGRARGRVDVSAWQAFSFIDVLLLITILVAVGLVVMAAATRSPNLPVAASALTAGLGILSVLLILMRMVFTPRDLGLDFFIFVALALAAGIAYGGWQSMQEQDVSFKGEADRLQNPGDGRARRAASPDR